MSIRIRKTCIIEFVLQISGGGVNTTLDFEKYDQGESPAAIPIIDKAPEWFFIQDYQHKKILYYHHVYKMLKRKFEDEAGCNPNGLHYKKTNVNEPIWVYWEQGLDQAPPLVKSCVRSIQRYGGRDVIVLSKKSIGKYVVFPDFIERKANRISSAAYADLLRFSLLSEFGGTWIDATVFLSDKLPEYILNSEFFAYQDTTGKIGNPALICNWLLHCHRKNPVMCEARNMTFAYWKTERYVADYLFTYMFLTLSLENHPDVYYRLPYANSNYCYLMLEHIHDNYDAEKFRHMLSLSSVHKLTYKLKREVYENKMNLYYKITEGD